MTDQIDNPFWEALQAIPKDEYDPREFARYSRDHQTRYRDQMVREFSWAIASPDALDFVAEHAPPAGLVEIGAGTGYWAYLLSQRGVSVRAYDTHPPSQDRQENHWHGNTSQWHPVRRSSSYVAKKHPQRALFLCWPPYNTPMASLALSFYQQAGGTRLIYIGESESGCTGDQDFHQMLDGLELAASHAVPQWSGVHDWIQVYDLPPVPPVALS